MTRLSPGEAALLDVARAVLGRGELRPPLRPPTRLTPDGARLLREIVAKGAVRQLGRMGWRVERCLEGDEVRSGRLWERHAKLPLHFTGASLALLTWLATGDAQALDVEPVTAADELLMYWALSAAQGTDTARALAQQPAIRRSALCWLGFAADLARAQPLEAAPTFELDGPFAWVLEALRGDLAQRWTAAERAKSRVGRPGELEAIGEAQDAVLAAFLRAAEGARRRDLCGFIIDAAEAFLRRPTPAGAGLDPLTPLSDRQRARRAAGALMRAVSALHRWDAEHRAVRFVDEGYAAAQALLADWERLGPRGFARAEEYLRQLESFGGSA